MGKRIILYTKKGRTGDHEGIHKAGEAIALDILPRYEVELKEMLSNYLTYRKQEKQGIKKLVYEPTNAK